MLIKSQYKLGKSTALLCILTLYPIIFINIQKVIIIELRIRNDNLKYPLPFHVK